MSSREDEYKLKKIAAESIRKERKKLLHGPYDCPKCKMDKLRIQVNKKKKEAIAICSCGLEYQLNYVSVFEPVDYYNKLIDQFSKK